MDPAWKYRALLTAKHAHLSIAQHSRLDQILATDDELAVVWAIKEITVQILATCPSVKAIRPSETPRTAKEWIGRRHRERPCAGGVHRDRYQTESGRCPRRLGSWDSMHSSH